MTRVTIVVPCFNEAQRLEPEAFLAAVREQPSLQLLMVDDGSTDDTLRALERLRDDAEGGIDVLALEQNGGKAEAVRQGVLHAVKSAPDAFGYFDADLSTPLTEVPVFERVLADRPGVELVMGSRVKLLGRDIERRVSRHYLGRVFATCASMTLGVPVYDTQCGAKLFRNSYGTRAAFEQPFVARWPFDVEILARLGRLGKDDPRYDTLRCVYEHPLPVWRDVAGSKIRFTDWFKAGWELWRIAWRYRIRGK